MQKLRALCERLNTNARAAEVEIDGQSGPVIKAEVDEGQGLLRIRYGQHGAAIADKDLCRVRINRPVIRFHGSGGDFVTIRF